MIKSKAFIISLIITFELFVLHRECLQTESKSSKMKLKLAPQPSIFCKKNFK